ncbi:hypothetical protein CKO18_15605 [Rhodoferax fermentans]|uniref:Uncharacterized protein n=1 Tax=Rhodoferax fermentans TaxID=28066 RepID=A0A1T1ATM2_RHOFE|nr:hypothetical protein [Rhodoferax fermentans]OOV07450.1 hypothetical protein RF819_12575 [Rhodoferax fermentans]
MTSDSRLVTPLPEAIWQLEQAAKTLKQTNPHGGQTVLTGVPTDQLRKIDVVLALVEQKQRAIVNDDLESRAELDKQSTLARIAKLQPVARKAAQGKADAEIVMSAIRSEPDQLLAINSLRHLLCRTHNLSVGNVDVVSDDQSGICSPDFTASRAYQVTLSVSSINADNGGVVCVLQDGQDLEPIFQARDLGQRSLQFQLVHDRLMLLGYCMLLGLHLKALISIRITLTAKGPSYKCSLITLQDEESLLASIRKAIAMQTPDLFS